MMIELGRSLMGIYSVVLVILWLNSFSIMVFDTRKAFNLRFIAGVMMAVMWPLALFSRRGRDLILQRIGTL